MRPEKTESMEEKLGRVTNLLQDIKVSKYSNGSGLGIRVGDMGLGSGWGIRVSEQGGVQDGEQQGHGVRSGGEGGFMIPVEFRVGDMEPQSGGQGKGRSGTFLWYAVLDSKDLGMQPSSERERSLLQRRLGQVLAELADVRELLLVSGGEVLSPGQLSVLQSEEEEHTATTIDPSIQFLGLEWEAIFGKCSNLGINIRIYRQRLDSGMMDTVTLALVLRDLHTVGQEVHHHSLAVTRNSWRGPRRRPQPLPSMSRSAEALAKTETGADEIQPESQSETVASRREGGSLRTSQTGRLRGARDRAAINSLSAPREQSMKQSIVDSLLTLFRGSQI